MHIGQHFHQRSKDLYSGALMIVIGGAAVIGGWGYDIGSLQAMGPGFFPVSVGALLVMVGLGIAVQAWRATPRARPKALPHEWRGWLCILSALIAFVIIGQYGGLLPASFVVGFIAALGDRKNRVRDAFLLALALSSVSVVVFWWALKVQFPLFQWG